MKMLTSPSEKWLTSYVDFWDVKKHYHTAQSRLMKKMSKKHNSNYENTEIRKKQRHLETKHFTCQLKTTYSGKQTNLLPTKQSMSLKG